MKKHKKIALLLASIILAALLVLTALEITNTTHFFNNTNASDTNNDQTAKTTSTAESAQPNFSGSDTEKEPGNSLNENRGSALVEETNNAVVKNDNPITSSTGEIIAYSPSKGSIVKTGTILSGTSTLSMVDYRITDSISGVIATGSLPVKDGKFSGKISFDTTATDGRIDLFATKSDFTEYSYIEIPIKFKN